MPANRSYSGLTLIELVASIAIVAVLISLVAGGMALMRNEARRAISLANLRTHAQVFTTYTHDYRGVLPHFTKPGWGSMKLSGGGVVVDLVSYFDAHRTWHVALADAYYQKPAWSDVFFPPGYRERGPGDWPIYTPYHYPCVFIADPRYWNEYTRTGPEQYRATRIDEVRFPSAKTLVVQSWSQSRRGEAGAILPPVPLARSDGAAGATAWYKRLNGYPRGDGPQFVEQGAVHFKDGPPLLHTIDGVLGRDIRY